MPVVLALILIFNWKKLNEVQFEHKFGAFYENVDLKAGKWIILEPVTFLVRRLVLSAVVVFTDKLIYQLLAIIATCVWQVKLVSTVKPYKSNFHHRMEIFNEVVIMFTVYTFMIFSDYVQDVDIEFLVGYFAIGFVAVHLFVNIGLIGLHSFFDCREKIRHRRWKKMHAKRVQDNLAAKLFLKLNKNSQNGLSLKFAS